MNPSFVLVLKSERCRYKQNRQLSFLVKRDANARKKEYLFTKFKSQIILMKKNGLNVEDFCHHITINYDKSSSAFND